MKEASTTEKEMREAVVPTPHSLEELNSYIESLAGREHYYGTCVYAVSMSSVATFNYLAHKLGITGFQASCADLDILRRTRDLDGPFMLLKAEDYLYPQYDLHGKLQEAIEEWKPWAAKEAAKNLANHPNSHPAVLAHWEKLAK